MNFKKYLTNMFPYIFPLKEDLVESNNRAMTNDQELFRYVCLILTGDGNVEPYLLNNEGTKYPGRVYIDQINMRLVKCITENTDTSIDYSDLSRNNNWILWNLAIAGENEISTDSPFVVDKNTGTIRFFRQEV